MPLEASEARLAEHIQDFVCVQTRLMPARF